LKVELDIEDRQAIALAVMEMLKPLIAGNGKQSSSDELLDVQGACSYLKVSKQWIYERTHLNEIPFYKMEGHLRFKKSELDKWLQRYHTPAALR